MDKFWVVFKNEYLQVVQKKSFIVGIILTPALMGAFVFLPAYFARKSSSSTEYLAIVDQSGASIGQEFAASLKQYKLDDGQSPHYVVDSIIGVAKADSESLKHIVDSLKTSLNNDEIKYIMIFKPDVEMADSNMLLISNAEGIRTVNRFERDISKITATLRLQNSSVNLSVDSVLSLTRRVSLPQQDAKGESVGFETKWFASMMFVMVIYFIIIGYGQVIMRSVIEEKSSRIMEVLVSSVTPFQLMLGKVLGLGGATLTQLFIWLALGGIVYAGSGALAMNIDPSVAHVAFNPVVLTFFCLFLIFGYIMFSTMFALVGSLVNSDKEAQNYIFPVTMLLVLPFIIGISIIQEPNSDMARTMSFVPLFTPTLMMMRIIFIAPSATHYSLFSGILGEAVLAFILLVLMTILIIWVSARIFRVGILMYGKRPTLAEIVKWVRY
ncbi:MAG: ABC transporter permease [Candidatus Zixiibacteriota bacterium]